MAKCKASIMLLSDSGEGKTYQLGELAKWWFRRTGGSFNAKTGQLSAEGERTTLYSGDLGGWSTVAPIIKLGIIQLVDLTQLPMPFVWLDKISAGLVPLTQGGVNTWVPPAPMYTHNAYDSMSSMSKLVMLDLAAQTAKGANIGGGASYKFTQGTGADMLTIASNNQTHYGMAQNRILKAIAESQLSTNGLVTWTARIRRSDEEGMAAIIGPDIAGKAMIGELPGWFTYTFHLAQEVMLGQPNKHVLYFEDHIDKSAPTSKALANGRIPAGIKTLIPTRQEPADVPKLLDMIANAHAESLEKLKTDMSIPLKGPTIDLASF